MFFQLHPCWRDIPPPTPSWHLSSLNPTPGTLGRSTWTSSGENWPPRLNWAVIKTHQWLTEPWNGGYLIRIGSISIYNSLYNPTNRGEMMTVQLSCWCFLFSTLTWTSEGLPRRKCLSKKSHSRFMFFESSRPKNKNKDYTSSHNHGSQKWVPPIVVTFLKYSNFPLEKHQQKSQLNIFLGRKVDLVIICVVFLAMRQNKQSYCIRWRFEESDRNRLGEIQAIFLNSQIWVNSPRESPPVFCTKKWFAVSRCVFVDDGVSPLHQPDVSPVHQPDVLTVFWGEDFFQVRWDCGILDRALPKPGTSQTGHNGS